DLRQIFARLMRPAHQRVLAAVHITRHTMPPRGAAAVGHGYAKKGSEWPRLRRLRSRDRQIKHVVRHGGYRQRVLDFEAREATLRQSLTAHVCRLAARRKLPPELPPDFSD